MREEQDRITRVAPGFSVSDNEGQRLGTVKAVVLGSAAKVAFVVLSLDRHLSLNTTLYAIPVTAIDVVVEDHTCYLDLGGNAFRELFDIREDSILDRYL